MRVGQTEPPAGRTCCVFASSDCQRTRNVASSLPRLCRRASTAQRPDQEPKRTKPQPKPPVDRPSLQNCIADRTGRQEPGGALRESCEDAGVHTPVKRDMKGIREEEVSTAHTAPTGVRVYRPIPPLPA